MQESTIPASITKTVTVHSRPKLLAKFEQNGQPKERSFTVIMASNINSELLENLYTEAPHYFQIIMYYKLSLSY